MSARARAVSVTIAAVAALALSACGAQQPQRSPSADAGPAESLPLTVTNCGAEVTFEKSPERVVLLHSAAVPFFDEIDVLDRVVARAGSYPKEYYGEATQRKLDDIPLLTDKMDTSGHLQISKEVVVAQQPDLVYGQAPNLSRETLDAVGIPMLQEPAMCANAGEPASFDDIYDQLTIYGRLFDRESVASERVEELRQRVDQVTSKAVAGEERTAAVLYPTVGGGVTYAYGTGSMAHPQLEAAGFTNVFGDVDERVFEVTAEEIIGRSPDALILLYSDGEPGPVEQAVTAMPGAEQIPAVKNGEVLVQLFNFTEPPTPLSVEGLERIIDRFGQ